MREKNKKLNEISKIFTEEPNQLALMPIEKLEIIENNLNLLIQQIQILKFKNSCSFSSSIDHLKSHFNEALNEKTQNYLKTLEIKRKIPFDLMNELERCALLKEDKIKPKIMKILSSNEKNDENLLTNVSHLYEEKFEIENIVD